MCCESHNKVTKLEIPHFYEPQERRPDRYQDAKSTY